MVNFKVIKGRTGDTVDVAVTRERIHVSDIAYSGIIRDSIGYIRVSGFTDKVSDEFKTAFLDLKKQGIAKLVIDLRDNGGGDDLRALAADPTGSTLDVVDAAVFRFAAATATDPASIRQEDIDGLRRLGLTDPEIADITYAVGVRLFFATVLDALGARLDAQIAAQVEPGVLAVLSVGRPPLAGKGPDS